VYTCTCMCRCTHDQDRFIVLCMVKRSPCHSRAGVHGVDRGNDISGLVQACGQGSIRHESSERHLLGNDDRSSVWPLPKVPWLRRCRYRGLQSYFTPSDAACYHMSPDRWWKYGSSPPQTHPYSIRHGSFPVALARTGVIALDNDGLCHQLTAHVGCRAPRFSYTHESMAALTP
jgi:hypothetical protein